jgi:hypothetical protein
MREFGHASPFNTGRQRAASAGLAVDDGRLAEDFGCVVGQRTHADVVDVVQFGKAKKEWFATFLKLPNGIASHDTFGRVFQRIDSQVLDIGVPSIQVRLPCGFTPLAIKLIAACARWICAKATIEHDLSVRRPAGRA